MQRPKHKGGERREEMFIVFQASFSIQTIRNSAEPAAAYLTYLNVRVYKFWGDCVAVVVICRMDIDLSGTPKRVIHICPCLRMIVLHAEGIQ